MEIMIEQIEDDFTFVYNRFCSSDNKVTKCTTVAFISFVIIPDAGIEWYK